MLTLLLSYHQVMPVFLDFVFPFGRQDYARDFHFSGFRAQSRLDDCDAKLSIPPLGWSGHTFELCYNLKSVERSKYQKDWPWSLRQCALYHSFDVQVPRMTWIMIEADPLLKRRLTSATGARGLPVNRSFQTMITAFEASLETHLISCEWSTENWRWYINFLEDECQAITRGTLSKNVESLTSPVFEESMSRALSRAETQTTWKSSTPATPRAVTGFVMSPRLRTLPQIETAIGKTLDGLDGAASPRVTDHNLDGRAQTQSPVGESSVPKPADEQPEGQDGDAIEIVNFAEIQRIQFIEENINEAKLMLKLNESVFTELAGYYNSIVNEPQWPDSASAGCKIAAMRFTKRIESFSNILKMQQMRIETLLRLLADRKSLVSDGDFCSEQS